MVTVKDVTQYTVALGVAKQQDFYMLLSHLKTFSTGNNSRELMSRWKWANELGIDRQTIRRWENEIIKPKMKFSYHYYNKNERQGKQGLDHYQRFFLCIIFSLMTGWVTGKEMSSYAEVIDYLQESKNGKPRWMNLTRDQFNELDKHYQHKQAS